MLAYVQWIIGFILIGRGDGEVVFRMFIGELIAKGIALTCFVLFPTTMGGLRPSVESLRGGVAAVEIGLFISGRLPLKRFIKEGNRK